MTRLSAARQLRQSESPVRSSRDPVRGSSRHLHVVPAEAPADRNVGQPMSQADDEIEQLARAVLARRNRNLPHYTLVDAIARYEENDLPKSAELTQRRARRELSVLVDRFGGESLDDDYCNRAERLYADYPESSASLMCARLSVVLNRAHRWGWRAQRARLGSLAAVKSKPRDRVFEDGEIDRLDAALVRLTIHPSAILAARFLLRTGMRVSETCRVRWDDLDADLTTLHIPIAKNKKPRTINLFAPERKVLESIDRVGPYCFHGRWKDRPINRTTVGDAMRLAARAAGLAGIVCHTARHDWASVAKRSGVADLHAEAHLGASVATLRKWYQHSRAEDVRAAAECVATARAGNVIQIHVKEGK